MTKNTINLYKETIYSPNDMNEIELAELILDMTHRMAVHHTLWFREIEHQLGFERAMECMEEAWEKTKNISIKRLCEGFEMPYTDVSKENSPSSDFLPESLISMSREKKFALMDMIAKNWIAQDGVFFQAVEKRFGMNDAKRCNDSAWGRFSPIEAHSVKKLLGLPEHPGLPGLERAFNFRMYGRLNKQSFDHDGDALIFKMSGCRVQDARKRKNMDDYPCKSGGLVEHERFARGIDDRIRMECVCCPPDEHPDEYYCAWKFYIDQ